MKKTKDEWITLKTGVLKNGNWYASKYPKGWFFVYGINKGDYRVIGPFKTFEDGIKEWNKNQ